MMDYESDGLSKNDNVHLIRVSDCQKEARICKKGKRPTIANISELCTPIILIRLLRATHLFIYFIYSTLNQNCIGLNSFFLAMTVIDSANPGNNSPDA
jgi:hypothetical protein